MWSILANKFSINLKLAAHQEIIMVIPKKPKKTSTYKAKLVILQSIGITASYKKWGSPTPADILVGI